MTVEGAPQGLSTVFFFYVNGRPEMTKSDFGATKTHLVVTKTHLVFQKHKVGG